MPSFTVIVPTHQRPDLLAEALASLRAQTDGDFECVVVDDASPTPPRLPSDPRFTLVRLDRQRGPAAARNAGLARARGRWVAFLDDDDLYTPERLALARRGHAEAPIALCLRRGLDGSPGGNRVLSGNVAGTILDGMTPHLGQVSVERALVPRFDERYAAVEDVEWWLRAAAVAPVTTVPAVGLLYRQHDGPRPRHGAAARLAASLQLLEEHAEWFARHPRAAAFRWKRAGLLALQVGDRALARRAFLRALARHPEPATLWHLARAARPGASRPARRERILSP